MYPGWGSWIKDSYEPYIDVINMQFKTQVKKDGDSRHIKETEGK